VILDERLDNSVRGETGNYSILFMANQCNAANGGEFCAACMASCHAVPTRILRSPIRFSAAPPTRKVSIKGIICATHRDTFAQKPDTFAQNLIPSRKI
jgi:hypothetical protein